MKAVFILLLALPLVILGCISIDGMSIDIGGDCFYYEQWQHEGEPITEVTEV